MSDLRLAWVGFHAEGLPALDALLAGGAPITDVLTLRSDLAARRSGGVDYRPVCEQFGVPLHEIANINDANARRILQAARPDVVFVIGWHQIVHAETLGLARIGMVGAHASVLPKSRGSAPINWALIRGEKESGNSLFWLNEEVDAGDLIDQVSYPITPYDTCASLYAQVAAANRTMLLRLWPRLQAGEVPRRPQAELATPIPCCRADGPPTGASTGRSRCLMSTTSFARSPGRIPARSARWMAAAGRSGTRHSPTASAHASSPAPSWDRW